MHTRKHTASEKLAIIQEIANGHIGVMAATQKFSITKTTLAKWRRRYGVYGLK
ncbi:helix-turn-helix domain-containing protein [Paenibacillus agricola]|uniref:Helix-turn-helix domain-containing protein n=1 Tax=Paenibacillus agricola TaxID=2716264 RepID=A0ABX0JH03_9BACL|nr:helix-turn-helix domain-containing protein [Paenibacillus agricola]NHN34675.1 helix-turn-helix domain-containing protein [Paenibacillus agricola]